MLAVVAFGVFVVWEVHDGGYAPEEWLPGGLLILGLLCTSLASPSVRARLWERRAPLLLLGLYVAWSYASISWAQVQGDALVGANRTLVYWLVFALFSGLELGRRAAALILGWCTAVAVAGVVAIAQAATASRPAGHFVLGRLAAPISYTDADAALFLAACLPVLVLASRRGAPLALRAGAGAVAVVLADLAGLCQSRGSAIVLPAALVAYVLVARAKLRALAHIAVLAVAATPAIPALLRVHIAVVHEGDWTSAVRHAAVWIAIDAALGALGFGLLALLDRKLDVAPTKRARIGRTLLAAGAAVGLAALVLVVAFAHPVSRLKVGWHDFSTNHATPAATPHFASGLGTSRYDVWRIALKQFASHPLTGVGADNYLVGYLQDRRTLAVSRYPESVELRALSETGTVGALMFFGFLAFALRNLWRGARRSYAPGVALACFAGVGYWLLHASVDWFWEYPALTGPAFALLALGGAPRALDSQRSGSARQQRIWQLGIAATIATAAVAAAAVLAVPWAAVRQTDQALAVGPGPRASTLLRTAAALDPLSEQPALAKASLAEHAGRLKQESRAFADALQRNPFDWYAYFMLGIVAGLRHQPALARADLAHAHRLSPKDNLVHYAQKRLAADEPMTQHQVRAIMLEISAPSRGTRQH